MSNSHTSLVNLDVPSNSPYAVKNYEIGSKCDTAVTHMHHYDHLTVVTHGGIQVEWWVIDDYEIIAKGITGEIWSHDPHNYIGVPKNVVHRIKALEDNTRYMCLHNHRDSEGSIVEKYEGNMDAYSTVKMNNLDEIINKS